MLHASRDPAEWQRRRGQPGDGADRHAAAGRGRRCAGELIAKALGRETRIRYCARVTFSVQVDRESDGRWVAEVAELPGVHVYGDSQEQAQAKAQALALRVLADRLEHGEAVPFESVLFSAA